MSLNCTPFSDTSPTLDGRPSGLGPRVHELFAATSLCRAVVVLAGSTQQIDREIVLSVVCAGKWVYEHGDARVGRRVYAEPEDDQTVRTAAHRVLNGIFQALVRGQEQLAVLFVVPKELDSLGRRA